MYIKAVDYYTKIDLSICDKETVFKIVNCYRNLNRPDDALNLLEMLTIENKDRDIVFLLATFYVDKKEYVKAEKLFLQLIEGDARNFKLYIYLESLYDLTGDFVHAKKMFDKASSLDTSYVPIDFFAGKNSL